MKIPRNKMTMEDNMPINKVVQFLKEIDFRDLSENVVEMGKKCLLDFVGASIAGHQNESASIAIESGKWLGNAGDCTIIGMNKKMSPIAAAYANGTLSSSLDIDDGHRKAVGHPGVMVIPAALASGELMNATGKELLTAIVAGYEIGIRCGIVMNSHHNRVFYGSGGWGVFGAAAAAAKMMLLQGNHLNNALTICEEYGPTALCGKSIEAGAMTKESVGWGGATGLFSALLAKSGFSGPNNILMDDHLCNDEAKEIFQTLGDDYEIENIYFKLYPSCKWSHSPITAAVDIKRIYNPQIGDIEEVTIETFSKALTLDHKSPKTSEAAQYSIPYTVATALCHGSMEPVHLTDQYVTDVKILQLADKIKMIASTDLEQLFPDKRPARVTVKMKNGDYFTKEVHVIKGDPEKPLGWKELTDKFHNCTKKFLTKDQRTELIQSIKNLERIKSLKEFTRKLQIGKSA
jgi:2-methylcitrate dehydratase PrpD